MAAPLLEAADEAIVLLGELQSLSHSWRALTTADPGLLTAADPGLLAAAEPGLLQSLVRWLLWIVVAVAVVSLRMLFVL